VIGMELVGEGKDTLLTITRSGFGKRTALSEYPLKGRGGKGVITIKNTAKLGDVVAVQMVDNNDHMLILTSGGRIIRLIMSSISIIGRLTQGRTLVKMNPGEHVVDVTRAQASENDDPDALEDDGIETAIPDDVDEPGLEEEELDEEEDTEDEEDVDDEDAK
jgi:DNA gyrase subunit A